MRGKRFRTRKHTQNTRVWLGVGTVLLVIALIAALELSELWLLGAAIIVFLAGLVISWIRDRRNKCSYYFDGRSLVLKNFQGMRTIDLTEATDASLIDRLGAREYIIQKRDRAVDQGLITMKESRDMLRGFVQYCSVDIGLTSFSFGFGRKLVDRMPSVRADMVLLRMKSGEDLLLSPVYAQVLVSSINKGIAASSDQEAPAKAS